MPYISRQRSTLSFASFHTDIEVQTMAISPSLRASWKGEKVLPFLFFHSYLFSFSSRFSMCFSVAVIFYSHIFHLIGSVNDEGEVVL